MTYLPDSHAYWRSPRVRLADITPAVLRLPDGRRHRCKLETISLTGGLLSMPNMLDRGSRTKLMFLTHRAGAWRSRDVESCFYDPATVPVRRARGRRSAETASDRSVVFAPWRASVDRKIQSSASSSETGATRSFPSHFWISYTPYTLGKCDLFAQRSSPKMMPTKLDTRR